MEEDKEKPKILIVEDDLEMGKTLSGVLKAKGYSPLVVLTGKEGAAAAKEEDISLALIDLKLPDISGIEVLKEIKKNSPRTEAIILTAFASLDTAMEAVNMGAFSYLEKPYDVERLLLDIRRALERKRAEEEVKKSHNFLASIIDNIPDTVTIKDPQHRFVLVNQAYYDITGHTKDEVIGKKTYWEKGKEVFQTGKELDIPERSFIDLEGKRHYVSVKKAPLTDESGKVAHVLTISRDITEHKRLDDERERVLKELKELDKLKTNFLNVAYHEMRSPLAPIVASASLLEQGYLTAKQKRLVFIIEQSVKQLEKLINRLLELTRVDAGKVKLRLKVVSIPGIVKNVLAYLKPLADAKKQTITIDVPERIEIEGDEQKITAIFDNLVSNAIKYTEKNGKIDIKAADRGGEDIVVSIADTGIGISEEQLSRVFERFFMADTSLSRKGGLGLGLSIVQEYVKLHGGKVWATSELGKGSKFGFTLPKKQK